MRDHCNFFLCLEDLAANLTLSAGGKTGCGAGSINSGKLNYGVLVAESGESRGFGLVAVSTSSALGAFCKIGGFKSGGPLAPFVTESGDCLREGKLESACCTNSCNTCAAFSTSCESTRYKDYGMLAVSFDLGDALENFCCCYIIIKFSARSHIVSIAALL
jgi:hypothetical protein